jgi:hypothetical protein
MPFPTDYRTGERGRDYEITVVRTGEGLWLQ